MSWRKRRNLRRDRRGRNCKRKDQNYRDPNWKKDWNEAGDTWEYCTYLEYRMAKLLRDHGIAFEYSKRVETVDTHGRPNYREVDFWLKKPAKLFWCGEVQAIEVKGGMLDERCWQQRRELRDAGVRTFIALREYIEFWETRGFLRENGLYKRKRRLKS